MRRSQLRSGDRIIGADYTADYFDRELHRDHWFTNNAAKRERRWREVLRMLEPVSTDRILEIGCAAGMHALKLAPLVHEMVGVDSALPGIRRAREHASIGGVTNAEFLACDAAGLPFADCTFDKVAAIDFVEHVVDLTLRPILCEVHRVLRPGGRFAIYTPCASHYVERLKANNIVLRQIPGHVAVRDATAYRQLLDRSEFVIHSLWFSPSDYPGFGVLDRLLARRSAIGPWFRFRICIIAIKAAL